MSTAAVHDFQQQLKEVEAQMAGISQEYADLLPGEQSECLERLEATIQTLSKIQKDLTEAQKKTTEEGNVLQVMGMHNRDYVTVYDFERAFKEIDSAAPIACFSLSREHNYKINAANNKLYQDKQCFLKFQNKDDARFVLGLLNCGVLGIGTNLPNNETISNNFRIGNRFQVSFARPTQDFATRETLRKIGTLVERLKEIEHELKCMGAVLEGHVWKPSPIFLDKSYFIGDNSLLTWKKAREAGVSLDHNAHGILRSRKPVDMAQLTERIKALSDEECDALIQLREFQLNGWDFDF